MLYVDYKAPKGHKKTKFELLTIYAVYPTDDGYIFDGEIYNHATGSPFTCKNVDIKRIRANTVKSVKKLTHLMAKATERPR